MRSKKTATAPKRRLDAKEVAPVVPANFTMRRIADLAGVSIMTVSRALQADGVISPSTRTRILDVVRQTGYVPDASARMLSSGRSGFVAVLVPSINNSNFADTTRGLSLPFERAGLQILLGDTEYSMEREEVLIATLLQRRPEAVVLTGGTHTPRARKMLSDADIPIVETWDLPAAPLDHVVGFSNAAAAQTMVRYLYERGYRNIAFIGGTTNRDTRGSDRRAGYMQAIHELGLPKGRVISVGRPPVSMEQGGEALILMLQRWPETDAVICVSDLSAFGVLMECHRRDIAVPGRIAIAGFGDFDVARCSWPRITTIAVDCEAIGQESAKILVAALDARKKKISMPPATVMMPFRVIPRETT